MPDSAVPSVPVGADGKPQESAAAQDSPPIDWWRSFGSAELSALVDRGIANSPDIRIATLKIAQAKARADQIRADQAPSVAASVGETIQAPGGALASVPVGATDNRTTQKIYQASARANWRLDLWGEQSALSESASLQVWQAAFERDNVQRNLIANLVANYLEFLSLNDRLRIAQEAEVVLSGILVTIEKRIEIDDASLMELEQQKATIFAVRATIPNLEQQREDTLTNMAFLVGALPGSLNLSADGLDMISLPVVVPALPSSLLLRRPDVRLMEARLLAADADVDVARARLLPPLDLSAQTGFSSLALSGMFKPANLFWNALANLTVGIFDSGKLANQKEHARVVHEEMVESYARTINQAVREVERALAAIRLTSKRFDAQQAATTAAQKAWDITNEIYAAGGMDHLTMLDAGRTYLRYLDDFQTIKLDRHRGYISLFQALGGGANFDQALPGKGVRPTPVRLNFANLVTVPLIKTPAPVAGADGANRLAIEGSGPSPTEAFWQVELPGLYHRVTIAPTWRDLRARYPKLMEGRIVRPRLSGRIDDSPDGQAAWYRLYVARFPTPDEAETLCTALKASYQRCRVLSSTSDDTVLAPSAPKKEEIATTTASTVTIATATPAPASEPQPEPQSPPAPTVENQPEAPVKVKTASGPTGKKPAYSVQLGAFSILSNAVALVADWKSRGYAPYLVDMHATGRPARYAVRTGKFFRREDGVELVRLLDKMENMRALLVPAVLDASGQLAVLNDTHRIPETTP